MQNDPQQEAGGIPPTMPVQPAPAPVPQAPQASEAPASPQYQYQQPQYQQYPGQYQQYPPYQQYPAQYPPYPHVAGATSQKSVLIAGLIGGAIAGGIDLTASFFFAYVTNIPGFLAQLYLGSLIYALLCSPGFFVAGLLATRKAGKMSSAMLACTLALACFAVVDFGINVMFSFLPPYPVPFTSLLTFSFWTFLLQYWFIDLVCACALGFGAAALGGAIGRKPAIPTPY